MNTINTNLYTSSIFIILDSRTT